MDFKKAERLLATLEKTAPPGRPLTLVVRDSRSAKWRWLLRGNPSAVFKRGRSFLSTPFGGWNAERKNGAGIRIYKGGQLLGQVLVPRELHPSRPGIVVLRDSHIPKLYHLRGWCEVAGSRIRVWEYAKGLKELRQVRAHLLRTYTFCL